LEFLKFVMSVIETHCTGCGIALSVAESMIDIHDNVDRYDAARKKGEAMGKGRNEKKREAKKHRAAMAAWSHRYPAELHDFRSTDLQVVSNPVELPRFYLSSFFHAWKNFHTFYRFAMFVREIRGTSLRHYKTKLPLAIIAVNFEIPLS